MMYSAGMALQDLVRNIVWLIGEQMITRRDSWLDKFKGKVPVADLELLRFSSLNGGELFDQTTLDNAIEAASEEKSGKVQDEMLSQISKISHKGEKPKESKFAKTSFQKGEEGAKGSGRGTHQGRGGQSRGGSSRGRGRGRFNKKKFSQE